MYWILFAALLLLALMGFLTAFLIRRLTTTDQCLPVTAQWLSDLSPDRYRPMLRLLAEEDFQFLRVQSGFVPEMEARLRAQRAQIFASYLDCLDKDFQKVCLALKVLLLQSRYDRPDLASLLVRNQILFLINLQIIRVRLFLYRRGLSSVDVGSLVERFDSMRIELRTLVPATDPLL